MSKETAETSFKKYNTEGQITLQFSVIITFLGSCRLSIFDLSNNANMPMQDASGRYTITYNGEIYNFIEIKKNLILILNESDTEV